MRIIARSMLREFWEKHPDAEEPLKAWFGVTQRASWGNFVECREVFSHADQVTLQKSGATGTVFNIGGNKYRLVCSIEYAKKIVFTLKVMTHAEYSRMKWVQQL